METHNPKRETQKVLDHPRERTQKNSDDAVQRNVNTSIQVRDTAIVPNVTSNRLTLATHSRRNVAISETVRRNLALEKSMLNRSHIPYDRVSTRSNNVVVNDMPSGTRNIVRERNDGRRIDSLPFSYDQINEMFVQLAKEVTIFNNPLIMDDDFRRELEAIREQSNLYRDERLRMETLPSSNQIDLEYMRHIVRCATMENDVNEYLERTKTNTRISSRNLNNRSSPF
ncbi:hypothetical protein EVAR_32076_1 [Eumeta japonica]|nr:hypothetical protein EVAR_32076_1 [Eumeta japonica]